LSDWHPCVVRLGKIESLPGSDFLEITTVMNEYPVILRKGEYKEGQLASFLPYDSVCPDTEFFHFLAPPPKKDKDGNIIKPTPPVGQVPLRSRTLRAKKIRGTYSEGIIVSAPSDFNEGDSVIECFSLTKKEYEEELPEKGANSNEIAPTTFSLFKYDLDGLAKYGYAFEDGEQVLITEKLEGENCTIVYAEDKLWVRSRNFFKRDEPDSHWWDLPRRLDLENKLKLFPGLAIWFELYGGVRNWKYDCSVVDGRLQRNGRIFDVFDTKRKKFLEWQAVEEISKQIGMDTVPVLYKGEWKTDRSLHHLAEGKSTIGSCVREGFVMRSLPEAWHEKLGRKIIKLKGRDYKLAKD
jgi:RNA ligase (TIGR02306 family)